LLNIKYNRWMEKIVGKRRDLPSHLTSLSLFCLSHLSHLSLHVHCTCDRPATRAGSPTTQDSVRFCLNEQYSTGQSDPNGRHQWNGKAGARRQHEDDSSKAP
jgi:hypothetical protein